MASMDHPSDSDTEPATSFRPADIGHLPRLASSCYQGTSTVFWTFPIQDRATGWLDPDFHSSFREILLHAAFRDAVACPVYCLMPDHIHLLLHGLEPAADQLLAVRFLRRHLGARILPHRFQHQAHDHVLRSEERVADGFVAIVRYVRDNPVRKGWVSAWDGWPYTGFLVPGFPDLDPRSYDFLDRFWRCVAAWPGLGRRSNPDSSLRR